MSTLPHLAQLPWQPGFADWGAQFSRPQPATPLPDLHWVSYNEALRADMQLPTDWWQNPRVLAAFGGNAPLPGSTPNASVYSGHQFGVWAGQLGDGRALNLGALATPMGVLELQLKGAGKTPYSRMGDGRAVLRSSIREYLASEAMWGLNIPTTRALCVVGSPQPVRRETIETAAVVTRVSPSFVRFGHFEHFAALNDTDSLWLLIRHLQPLLGLPSHAEADAQPVLDFLRVVVERTATLLAQWQCVGFCHGVMNTDNMSILGLTLDYGPFQFMDGFDVHHICNHSDTGGRYAFGRQPQVAYWNLFCLGKALLPLVPAQEDVVRVLETFKNHFAQSLTLGMNAKLGLSDVHETDADLQQDLLQLLDREHVDWTVFWRRLSVAVQSDAFEPVRDLFIDRDAWQAWLARYRARLDAQCATSQLSPHACGQTMLRINPKYVLRNYLAELAIADAKVGDYACLHDLLTVLHSPFDEHPQHEAWAQVAPEWASRIEVSCSS